jgi:Sec-independent protein translocase protein TatA
VGIIGRLWSGFWTLAILFAITIVLAGTVVANQLARNGGHALGAGLGAAGTFVQSMGGGWQDYAVTDANANINDAEKRAKAAEKRAKKAEDRAKKAQGRS